MKKFSNLINPINETEMAFSDIDFSKIQPYGENPNLKELSLTEIGKQGKLSEYIDQGNIIRFGVLKALYQDAIEYKKKREYQKGIAKFVMRAIPLAMAPIFFPIWLVSQILGTTRAVNKVIIPALNMEPKTYDSFLKNLVTKTMNLAEGDIKPFLGNDWYYDVFYVHDGLTKMVRQEYIYQFTLFITEEIQKKDDNLVVPHYWLDTEFRKWLNEKFDIDLPIGKVMIRHKNKD
jgi:hypothetical protein